MPVKDAPVLDETPVAALPEREKRYLVRVKNEEYSGKTLGVKFERGKAIIEKLTIDERLGRGVEEIAWFFRNDFHYEVTEI